MVRGGPGSYKLKLNNSVVEADTFILRDGGLLIQVSLVSISFEQSLFYCLSVVMRLLCAVEWQ